MAIFLKFLGCMILSCISSWLGAFTIENRTHDIAIVFIYDLISHTRIVPTKASVQSIDSYQKEITSIENLSWIELQSGEKAEITLDENIDQFTLEVCHNKPWYAVNVFEIQGCSEKTSKTLFQASYKGKYILEEQIKLIESLAKSTQ